MTGNYRWISILFLFIIPLFIIIKISHAGDFVQGGKATGMGTAFTGVADDPSSIFYNPGGLSKVKGANFYFGVTGVIPNTEFEGASEAKENVKLQAFFPPHLYISYDFGTENIVFGMGFYSPFGIDGRKWSGRGQLRYLSVESYMATYSANPTIAYQIMTKLGIAIGMDYMVAVIEEKRKTDQSLFGSADGGYESELMGDGWGFNAGILFAYSRKLKIGLAYRSKIKVDTEGDVLLTNIAPAQQGAFGGSSYKTDARGRSTFPDIYSFGIAFNPEKAWIIDLDIEWVRWSSFDKMNIDLENEVPGANFVDTSTPLNWKDTLKIKIGTDYKMDKNISLRGGYAYVLSPVPESTLGPGNPDADRHNFSLGFGYKTGPWVIDFFYNLGIFERRIVENNIIDGIYENVAHYAGVSVGYGI